MAVPLRERVAVPPELPRLGGGLAWRGATHADVDAVVALHRGADEVDHPHYRSTREEIEDDLTSSWVDTERDCVLGFDGRDLVAQAAASLAPTRDPVAKVYLWGVVRPDRRGRGIGRQLLAWQRGRAHQHLGGVDSDVPGWVWTMVDDTNVATGRLFEAAGFPVARYFQELRLRFDGPLPEAPLPAGLRFAAWAGERSDAIRTVKNTVFADHWGSAAATIEQWTSTITAPVVRPDLSILVETPEGEIVGFVLAESDEGDWAGTGFSFAYLHLVGVTRAWRGRGVARAMLAEVLRRTRDAGLEGSVLGVDSENPSGATRLYAALGYRPATGSRAFVEVV